MKTRKEPRTLAERAVYEVDYEGKITSPDVQRLFTGGKSLGPAERALRDEAFPIIFDLCRRSYAQLKRRTGMHRSTAQRILRNLAIRREERPGGKEQEHEHDAQLEEIRFQGRKQLIDLCFDGAQKALEKGIAKIDEMKPIECIKAGAILTDKGLLLAGQPTSRVARVDEKMLSDEELGERLEKLRSRRFKLIEGRQQHEAAGP